MLEEVVVDTSNEKQVAKATQDAFAGAFDLGLQEESKPSEPVEIEVPEIVSEPEPKPEVVPQPEPEPEPMPTPPAPTVAPPPSSV